MTKRRLDEPLADSGIRMQDQRVLSLRWLKSMRRTLENLAALPRRGAAAIGQAWRDGIAESRTEHDASPLATPSSEPLAPESGSAAPEREPSVTELTVRQLKSRAAELGLNTSGCTERGDLVALLRGAMVSGDSPAGPTASPKIGITARRRTLLRRSLRRQSAALRRSSMMKRSAAQSKRSGSQSATLRRSSVTKRRFSVTKRPVNVAERLARQREELGRIVWAVDAFQVLGLAWNDLRPLARKEREQAVLKRYRDLCRRVHPDKCPPELCNIATRAFQRLEMAKQRGTNPKFLGAQNAVVASAAMRGA